MFLMIVEPDFKRHSCRRTDQRRKLRCEEEYLMKKYTRILVAITFLLGLGVAANAEIRPQILVTLPFDFVVAGRTLAAGTYVVERFSDQPFNALILTSRDNRTSVFVNPTEMEDATGNTPKVRFHQVGGRHVLSAIQTDDYVYNFRVPRSVTLAAAAKPRDTASVSGSAGSN
jgi:hypothetical protein